MLHQHVIERERVSVDLWFSDSAAQWHNILNLLERSHAATLFTGITAYCRPHTLTAGAEIISWVCSLHRLYTVLLSSLSLDKEWSGAKETRYGHYWERRLTIVANLQATVSAQSEDSGFISPFSLPAASWQTWGGHQSSPKPPQHMHQLQRKCCQSWSLF